MLQSATVHPATLELLKKLIKVSWQTVKKTIEKKVEIYLKQTKI